MKTSRVMAFALMLGISSTTLLADTFDMGKVHVVGKDAQEEKINPVMNQIEMKMGKKFSPMPQIISNNYETELKPLSEKKMANNIHKENKEEISVALGLGNRSSNELVVDGKGVYNGYTGDIKILHSNKDGYKSFVDTELNSISGELTSAGEGSYNLTVGGEYTKHDYAQRGSRLLPTPDAGINDSVSRINVEGNSTLENGAYFTSFGKIDSFGRTIKNSSIGFSEDQSAFGLTAGASYMKSLNKKFTGRVTGLVKSDKFTSDNGPDRKLTKSVLTVGGDYDISKKSLASFGFKNMNLMSRDRFSPYITIDYRWAKPWQAVFSYDEDMRNDSVEDIFMPQRYVVDNPLKASHVKKYKGSINYKTGRGDTLGFDLFSERENDAIEYIDSFDPGKSMLTSAFRFVPEVKRTGTSFRGNFKIEDDFKIKLKTTYQTPEDTSTGRRLSYEPERTLDVGFNYTKGKLMMDFTRRAEFDRSAYTPTAKVKVDDYSRSDLIVRYKINKRYNAYLKIKDLYDEAKDLRSNVPEEGRVSVAGVEAHF